MSASQMLCIGYGQFPPSRTNEMVIMMFSIVVGSIIWAVIIGDIVSIIATCNADKEYYREQVNELRLYMNFKDLPKRLRRDILDYHNTRYSGKNFKLMRYL